MDPSVSSDTTLYYVYLKLASDSAFPLTATQAVEPTSVNLTGGVTAHLTGLTPSTAYTVGITAVDGSANESTMLTSDFTTTAAASSSTSTTTPTAATVTTPGNLRVDTRSKRSLIVSWDASTASNGGAVYYQIDIKDKASGETTTAGVTSITTATISGLNKGTEYEVSVVAVLDADSTVKSAAATVETSTTDDDDYNVTLVKVGTKGNPIDIVVRNSFSHRSRLQAKVRFKCPDTAPADCAVSYAATIDDERVTTKACNKRKKSIPVGSSLAVTCRYLTVPTACAVENKKVKGTLTVKTFVDGVRITKQHKVWFEGSNAVEDVCSGVHFRH